MGSEVQANLSAAHTLLSPSFSCTLHTSSYQLEDQLLRKNHHQGSATFSFFRYCSITDDWNRNGLPFSRPFFPDFLVIGNTTEKEKNLLAKNKKKSSSSMSVTVCATIPKSLSSKM